MGKQCNIKVHRIDESNKLAVGRVTEKTRIYLYSKQLNFDAWKSPESSLALRVSQNISSFIAPVLAIIDSIEHQIVKGQKRAGFLLHGPKGVGKTVLAKRLAGTWQLIQMLWIWTWNTYQQAKF